jgi:hypothetical protein
LLPEKKEREGREEEELEGGQKGKQEEGQGKE